MSPLLAALGSGLAFAALQILFKRKAPGLPTPLILPSWLGLLFPVWLAAFLATYQTGHLTFNLTSAALVWPFLWAVCTVTTTTGLVWLLARFSLSELAGYKKALITLGAAGADILLFGTTFPLFTILSILLMLTGAIGLSQSRSRLPTWPEFAVIIGWCAVLTAQISFYKTGLRLQPHVLSHTILAQLCSTALYGLLWLLPSVRRQPTATPAAVLPILAVALTGVLLEGFAYAGLPLAVVLVITMLPAALMAGHDLWRRDLPRTPLTFIALLALLAGFSVLILTR